MEPGFVFALVWAVLAVAIGIALITRRDWLAARIRAEREAPGMRPGLRSPKPWLFLLLGLLFAAMGVFIIIVAVSLG
ncbi:hypothetical protein [Agromyces archimandritae]|uniref:Uncharacterized protein n=1 Tax=Agromyces archimandritae TaxID=2781962 RepID=A0A975IMD5_9MICO|nr:hypothetical protein [Agromyces archimandritae]QTX03397.1 hypothetical protein G127AT_08390 [Agromyces archimandritae]